MAFQWQALAQLLQASLMQRLGPLRYAHQHQAVALRRARGGEEGTIRRCDKMERRQKAAGAGEEAIGVLSCLMLCQR